MHTSQRRQRYGGKDIFQFFLTFFCGLLMMMNPKCAELSQNLLGGDWFSKLLYQGWLPSLFQHCLPTFAASYSLAEYWEHGSGN